MNIKTLRKSYQNLNVIERHSLFMSSIMRNDKSEETAVVSASPTELREIPDFTHLYQKVISLFMIVIIHKADSWINWQTFCEFETEQTDKQSRLSLYYFFVYSDAWLAVCEQINIDPEAMEKMMFPDSFIIWRLALMDNNFRKFAFTEAEARACIGQFAASEGRFAMTVENKIKEFREFLDLPKR